MANMSVDQVLAQMRSMSPEMSAARSNEVSGTNFSDVLTESINQVNELQGEASAMQTAYEMGDPNVDIPEVMVAIQKASVSFEAMTEVRNKLLTAYQEIMNMQV